MRANLCRLPSAVNVMLKLSIVVQFPSTHKNAVLSKILALSIFPGGRMGCIGMCSPNGYGFQPFWSYTG